MQRYLKHHHIAALHYIIRIFIGTVLIQLLLAFTELNSLWAIVSLIIITDPSIKTAWEAFIARFINTIIGSIVGIAFIYMFGLNGWLMALGIATSGIFSSFIAKMQQGWRIGPITTAIVMSSAGAEVSPHEAMIFGLERTGSVLLGSVVALIVTLSLARYWMPPLPEEANSVPAPVQPPKSDIPGSN